MGFLRQLSGNIFEVHTQVNCNYRMTLKRT